MPLLRGMARTAVVAGTATAVSNRVSRRQGQRWQRQEEAQYDAQAPAPTPQPAQPDPMAQLRELGDLREKGILTDEEFAAQKAKILA